MKRVSLLDYSKCIFCQDDKDQKLITPKFDGLNTIDNARQLRMKIRYDNYKDATDRLTEVYSSSPMLSMMCHNGCRSSYTSSAKLQIVQIKSTVLVLAHQSLEQVSPHRNS